MSRYSLIVGLAVLLAAMPLKAETYINKEYGFAIDLPAGWQVKGSFQSNTVIKAVHKDGQGRIALIAVAAYPMDAEGDIWKLSGEQMFEGFQNEYRGADSVLLDSGKVLVGSEHAVWTFIDVRSPPVVSMLTRSYHLVRSPLLFRISTSSDRDEAWFTQHERAFQESVASFRFLNAHSDRKLKVQERGSVMSAILLSIGEVSFLIALTWLLWTPAKLAWTRRLRTPAQYAAVVAWIIVGGIFWFLLFGHVQSGRWLWN